MRYLNIFQALKNCAWMVPVLVGCSASESPSTNLNATLQMTQQSADFVREYEARQMTRAVDAGIPLQMSIRIGASTDTDVCQTGELYGPYTVTNNTVEGGQTVTASPPVLRLANLGGLAVCTIITSPVDATLDISADSLSLNTTECNDLPANISGNWAGSYSCTSNCGNFDGYVSLNIIQDAGNYSATYTDSEASYEGTVCGNAFNYSGSGPGYTESGTFVLNSDGTGSKTSSYVYNDGLCSGSCSDPVLHHY